MHDLALIGLELAVVATALALLVLDLWTPPEQKRYLGYLAAAVTGLIFLGSFAGVHPGVGILQSGPMPAFGGMFVLDELALFGKRFFLLTGFLVLLMSVDFAERFPAGVSEFYALVLLAVAGMMFATSANDFSLLFVSLELITVTFYILTSYQRRRVTSLEAGAKYLILGALSSAFLVYGIAFIFGVSGTLKFSVLHSASEAAAHSPLLKIGFVMLLAGLGFKLAMVPFQLWAPDVYQGAPAPVTALLAVGSKAAGMFLLLRVLHQALPPALLPAAVNLLSVLAGLTILYGNLAAIPQRNIKRLLGYSSIANAGYLLMGVVVTSSEGISAILYFLAGYLFTLLAAFIVISVATKRVEDKDLSALAGLHRRSPLLAAGMAMAMVSLAGVPPLAGFFGKFLLIKAALAQALVTPGFFWLLGVAIFGVLVSFYYYFGVIRAMYWEPAPDDASALEVSGPMSWALYTCMAGILFLGLFPNTVVNLTQFAAQALNLP